MKKLNTILQYAYLIIAVVFFIDAVFTYSTNAKKALLMGAFAIMAVMMFFLKRKVGKNNY